MVTINLRVLVDTPSKVKHANAHPQLPLLLSFSRDILQTSKSSASCKANNKSWAIEIEREILTSSIMESLTAAVNGRRIEIDPSCLFVLLFVVSLLICSVESPFKSVGICGIHIAAIKAHGRTSAIYLFVKRKEASVN